MNRRGCRALAVAVIAVFAVGCATASAQMSGDEAIAARQKLMKEQGATMKSIQDKLKAGQAQAIGPDAQKLVETSKRIPALFPEGSLNPNTSRAKPEIWQKRSQFEEYAKALQSKATKLAQTAPAADAQTTTAAVGDLGKNACGACHDAFRGPEIKK